MPEQYLVLRFLLVGLAVTLAGCRQEKQPVPTPPLVSEAPKPDTTGASANPDSLPSIPETVFSDSVTAPIKETPNVEASGNTPVGHCDVRQADNLCIDFTGADWTSEDAQSECGKAGGSTYRSDRCPADNRVGTCVIHPNGIASLEMIHSFYAPMPAILAEGVCPGRFQAE